MTENVLLLPKLKSHIEKSRKVNRFSSIVLLLVMREWRRLFMEPSRLVGMLIQPLLFLAVFGLGFRKSFHLANHNTSYMSFFFPGILGLVVLFSSIYATLTLVDDKKCGFFRLVLVGPTGVRGAVFGKVCATLSMGFMQSLLFLPLGFLLGLHINIYVILLALFFLFLGSLCFSLLGVLFAWICESSSAFHALMSVFLIPMWLLSGAVFPVDDGVLWWASLFNPMAYLVYGLRGCLLNTESSIILALISIMAFCVLFAGLLTWVVKRYRIE